MDLVKITDLTRELGVSSRSLRYYEQAGLIQSVRPPFEKFRYYDEESVERLKQILVLRKMQIPIRDILRIYESQDMSVVVEVFVRRIDEIDDQVNALSELKRTVDEFLQTMVRNGIKKISGLPLLYEELDKRLERREERGALSYGALSAAAEKLAPPADVSIVDLPAMAVLTSRRRDDGLSDGEGFWDWLGRAGIPPGLPGRRELFEYQNDAGETVFIRRMEDGFHNDSPFADDTVEGGLFAVAGVSADEDVGAFHRAVIGSLDGNPYYEVDYRPGGRLRHGSLAEPVLSPDGQREKILLYVPVKRRLPDASLYEPGERAEGVTAEEIEAANPALWTRDVPLNGLTPILDPYYQVNDAGEAEYIAYIDKRVLSTGVAVRLPFRVDVTFKVDDQDARFGYGTDEGSLRLYHGSNLYGVNMHNSPDSRLSQRAVAFNQPLFGELFRFPQLGALTPGDWNRLTWVVGEKHFAVLINGQVRYCGVNFPYMATDLSLQPVRPVVVGSNGQCKVTFRSIRVSQLKQTPRVRIQEGALTMITRPSNNRIPIIHPLITMHYGENYWFDGCAKYVFECLGETGYDYWLFAGLTGDVLAQAFTHDYFRGDGVTDYRLSDEGGGPFIEGIFEKCGYAGTYVPNERLKANREMYLNTLMAYMDKGIPVIRYQGAWGVFVGYEDYGKTLLVMTADKTEPERVPLGKVFDLPDGHNYKHADHFGHGWVFVGERKRQVALRDLYRDTIGGMSRLLATENERYCFGAGAFRAWADEIEGGKFDAMAPEQFEDWFDYQNYVCIMATNGSCCHGFLDKALELNPDMGFIRDISALYRQTARLWNDCDGRDLEALGGGFNVTLAALQDRERRAKIAATIREAAVCLDEVAGILRDIYV